MAKSPKILAPEDSTGFYIPTLNQMGYMTTQLDSFSKEADIKGQALEIGAAYGIATLSALSRGVKMVCNDLDPRHLAIVEKLAATSDRSHLELISGAFPYELNFPNNSFDAILICRVLHLFDGETIEKSLLKIYQ